jgi:methylmalonyl-CoA/ethylmalonyl-CoA epimerase
MIVALDHIGIAVPDLEKAIQRFVRDFGLNCAQLEDLVAAKTTAALFPLPATSIELLHPLNGEGPIAKFLEKVDCIICVSVQTILKRISKDFVLSVIAF